MKFSVSRFLYHPGRFVLLCFLGFSLVVSFTVLSYRQHIDKYWEEWDQYRGLYLSADYESAATQLKEAAYCSAHIEGAKYIILIWALLLLYNVLLYVHFKRFEKQLYSDAMFISMRRVHVLLFISVFTFFALDFYIYWRWLTYAFNSFQGVENRLLLVAEPSHADFETLKRIIYRLDSVRRCEYESYRVLSIFVTLLLPFIKYMRIKPRDGVAVKVA